MSKEATGSNGALLGSPDYWDRVNRSTLLGDILPSTSSTEYYKMLEKVGENARSAIEEIYRDLSEHGNSLHKLPSSDRNSLAKQVEALYDVCRMTGKSSFHSSDCVNGLSLSGMSPWSKPFRDESAIKTAVSLMKSNSYFSGSEALSLVREAARWGISFAAGSNERKKAFLEVLAQGKNDDFLQDVADEYEDENGSKDYRGKCGYSIGSSGYLNAIESEVFGKSLPMTYSAAWGSPDYERLLRDGLRTVAERLERDLDDASRENYYITDETARKLKDVVSELSRCGVSTFSLESKIEKLAWFVGGDSAKILRLQRDLNELGFGRLTEDGVYGKKTLQALDAFHNEFARGTYPALAWVDPLRDKSTGIKSEPIPESNISALWDYSSRSRGRKGKTIVFRADTPHGKYPYLHINTVEGRALRDNDYIPTSELQRKSLDMLNHKKIDEKAYRILKDFDGHAKKVRVAGKILAVMGAALDALEIAEAVERDLNDADRKLGRTTCSTIISIGGSWGFGAAGAEVGAALGASIGTAILPGVGTAIGGVAGGLVLGIVGSSFGSKLGDFVVDITELE